MNQNVRIFLTAHRSYVKDADPKYVGTIHKADDLIFARLTDAVAFAMRLGMDCRFDDTDSHPIGTWSVNDGLRIYSNLNAQGEIVDYGRDLG